MFSQTAGSNTSMQEELQVEAQAGELSGDVDDDSYLLLVNEHRKQPLNLNYADEGGLLELRILTALQVEQFLAYRSVFGRLLNIYELQAVPGWDLETIRRIRPMVTVREHAELRQNIGKRQHQTHRLREPATTLSITN
ncbi:MAG: hypothetical protein EOO88_24265 [Pedobacter sp.]|nr:MAG: hypothetical protein EOO88_24265 [Pedobacter sp.]